MDNNALLVNYIASKKHSYVDIDVNCWLEH
jgi:hypothetical protein